MSEQFVATAMPATSSMAITDFRPSENAELSNALFQFEDRFEVAARQNLETALAQVGQSLNEYTQTEQMAMVKTEALRMVGGMELAAILLRGKMLQEIEELGLWSAHPNRYGSLEALAEEQGISLSELSDTRTMTQIIFPWIVRELGLPIAIVWEKVGKSKFRAMVPVFKALITGEMPGRGTARQTVERILDDTAASLQAMGQQPSDAQVRRQAIDDLLTAGEQMSAGDLRQHIRDGIVTPAIEPVLVLVDGHRYMLAEVSDDEQFLVMKRKMGRHMAEPARVELPADRRRRQQEAARVRILREINRIFEG